MADEIKIEVEVKGAEEAEKKLDELKKKQDEATEATKRNTEAARENERAHNGTANAASGLGKELTKVGSSAQKAGTAMSSLNFVKFGIITSAIQFLINLVTTLWKKSKETKDALEQLRAAGAQAIYGANQRRLDKRSYDYASMGDSELAGKITASRQNRERNRQRGDEILSRISELSNVGEGSWYNLGAKYGSGSMKERTEEIKRLEKELQEVERREDKWDSEYRRAMAERQKRMESRRKLQEQLSEKEARSRREYETQQAREQSERQKLADARNSLGLQKEYDEEERNNGRVSALERMRGDLQGRKNRIEEENSLLREVGADLPIDTEKELLDIDQQIYAVEKQISDEKDRQAKQAELEKQTQADWLRSRKLAKMEDAERLDYINKEIDALRTQERTAENVAKMRNLYDERDATQRLIERTSEQEKKDAEQKSKESAELEKKKQDFLHRNDSDAQRLASIGKQLEAAGATGDQAQMLELMMAGEDIAENYQEPQTKRQQRRAARKAERDAKAAMREARAFRKQVAGVDAAWNAGDKSAAEAVAGMHTDAQGNTYAMKMNDNGKMVKVEGQDLTNYLLEEIKKALT